VSWTRAKQTGGRALVFIPRVSIQIQKRGVQVVDEFAAKGGSVEITRHDMTPSKPDSSTTLDGPRGESDMHGRVTP
jgi:hypothetical protein